MLDRTALRVLAAFKRSWWLPVGAAVIAAVVVIAALSGSGPTYEGRATLEIDTATVSRYPGLPVPEKLLAQLQGDAFIEQVMQEAGVEGGELTFYTTGNPQTGLHVQYVGDDESDVRKVTDTAALLVVDKYVEMGESEIQRIVDSLEEMYSTRDALEATADDPSFTPYEAMDVRWRVYSVSTSIIANEYLIKQQRSAYEYNDVVNVFTTGGTSDRIRAALAAALLGLALGAVLAVIRERPWRVEATEG